MYWRHLQLQMLCIEIPLKWNKVLAFWTEHFPQTFFVSMNTENKALWWIPPPKGVDQD